MESQISVSLRKSVRLALVSLLTFVAFAAQPSSSWSQANDTSAAVTLVSPPASDSESTFHPLLSSFAASREGEAQEKSYVLLPMMPDLSQIEIPRSGMSIEESKAFVRELLAQHFGPLIEKLEALRQEGLISSFTINADSAAIAVWGASAHLAEQLAGLPLVASVHLSSEFERSGCQPLRLDALAEEIHLRSQAAIGEVLNGQSTNSLGSSPPTISVRIPTRSGWSYVEGRAASNATVTMNIIRAGRVIVTVSTQSSSSGYYYFSPTWQYSSCGDSIGYSWTVQVGDVIEVTSGGQSSRTTVQFLRAWADPSTDTVAGTTAPNQQVRIQLDRPDAGTPITRMVFSNSGGSFAANFSDFNRRARAHVAVVDGAGNETFVRIDAFRLGVQQELWRRWMYAFLKPEVSYTLTVTRGSSVVFTATGTTDERGYLSHSLPSLQPGDLVSVSGGGITLRYTVVPLSELRVGTSASNTTVTGRTAPEREVRVCKGYVLRYEFETRCSFSYSCHSATSGSDGYFAVDVSGLLRGDRIYITVFDQEGNQQLEERYAPAILANPQHNEIRGFWISPTNSLNVTVRRPDNNQLAITLILYGYLEFRWNNIEIPAGSVITVTDGFLTETMRVQALTARVDESSGRLLGVSSSGRIIAKASSFDRQVCTEADVAGQYSITFSEMPLKGQSSVQLWLRGSDGHYTEHRVNAFTVNAFMNTNQVNGYTEEPNSVVTVTLQRGGSTLATITTTSLRGSGFYSVSLPLGSGQLITANDTIIVRSSDGDSTTLVVPQLTVIPDGSRNRAYGRAPAGSNLAVLLRRWLSPSRFYSFSRRTTASSTGEYEVSFANLLYSWNGICSSINVAHRCTQLVVRQYNDSGHASTLEAPRPAPIAPDSFENDDTPNAARPYTGVIQIRSFHVPTDTDWVTFTVSAADASNETPYIIAALHEGWGGGTCIDLQTTTGSTLTSSCSEGSGPILRRTFSDEGTYRLRIYPFTPSNAGHCDASYRLVILPTRHRVFLPVTTR